jgi:hypothetical protein
MGDKSLKELSQLDSMQPDWEDATGVASQGATEFAARLRAAVHSAGTLKAVSERSGIPSGTLAHYLRGREMRVGAVAAVARATGVRLEWLATGAGPMRAEQLAAAAAPVAGPAAGPDRLLGRVNFDRLVDAYEGALATTKGVDRRMTMHLTAVLYDQLSEAAETQAKAGSAPPPGGGRPAAD